MNEAQKEFKGRADVERFLEKSRADMLSPQTLKKYNVHLGLALRYFNKEPADITTADIEQWRYEMAVNRKYEIETQWGSLIILRKFLRFIGKTDIADKITTPKRPSTVPPEKEIWLLPEEEKAMNEKSKELGIREHAIMRLFLNTGIRIGELRGLDLSDFDSEKQIIHIRHGKGNKSRIVPIDTETKQAILNYLSYRKEPVDGSEALFTSQLGTRLSYNVIATRVKECAVLAGIRKNITPHKLRHTFITKVIERTKDIPLAQKLAGHTEIKTTMRYHHTTHEQVVAKYREFFDSPCAKEQIVPQIHTADILRGLDMKFIKGELPLDLYIKLRNDYQGQEKINLTASKKEHEVAYQ